MSSCKQRCPSDKFSLDQQEQFAEEVAQFRLKKAKEIITLNPHQISNNLKPQRAGDYGDDGGDMEWDDARSDSVASTTSAASAGVRGLLLESAEPTRDARQNGARNNPLFKGSRDNSVDRHGYISDPDSERSSSLSAKSG